MDKLDLTLARTRLKTINHKPLVSTVGNKLNTAETIKPLNQDQNQVKVTSTKPRESLLVDDVLDQYSSLINPQFTAWYAKAVYTLGVQKFHQLAGMAKQGDRPRQLFSYLVKLELSLR